MTVRRLLVLVAAAAPVGLVLMQPNHPSAANWRALAHFPLELPAILGALAAAPRGTRVALLLRGVAVAGLLLVALLKLADLGVYMAYNRGFSPLVDLHLIEAGWRLATGAVGAARAALALLLALAGLVALGWTLWWASGRWTALVTGGAARASAAAIVGVFALLSVTQVAAARTDWSPPIQPPGSAFTTRFVYDHVRDYRRALADLAEFRRAAQRDPYRERERLLDLIGDRDVVLVFIESYGRSSLEHPLYADTHRATLRSAEAALGEAGLAMRSSWLTSPVAGGQSWLAHATLASGLWISDQSRYRAVLASERRTLFHLAETAGFHTATAAPAITLDWPEAELMGFETVLAADDLGYAGEPFNWVTMPDQYTLSAFDRLLRGAPDARPLFAEVALISSHAPWVPIPPLIGWDEVGDGIRFNEWATSGDPPSVIWRDYDRVRAQYRKAVDYSLETVGSYALRHAEDPPLMIVLGDHQPAGFVAMSDSMDVPVHVIGPPDLVEQLDGWGWSRGLVPGEDAPVWRMDAFRDRFLAAFSSDGPAS